MSMDMDETLALLKEYERSMRFGIRFTTTNEEYDKNDNWYGECDNKADEALEKVGIPMSHVYAREWGEDGDDSTTWTVEFPENRSKNCAKKFMPFGGKLVNFSESD